MTIRIGKKEVVQRVASRTGTQEAETEAYLKVKREEESKIDSSSK